MKHDQKFDIKEVSRRHKVLVDNDFFLLVITAWQLPVTYAVPGLVGVVSVFNSVTLKANIYHTQENNCFFKQPLSLKTSILHELHQNFLFLHCRYTINNTFQILEFLSVIGPKLAYIKLPGQKKKSKELYAAMNERYKPHETAGTAYSPWSLQKLQPYLNIQDKYAENKAYLNLFSSLPDYSPTIWPQICLPWLKKYTEIKHFKVHTDLLLSCVSVLEAVLLWL